MLDVLWDTLDDQAPPLDTLLVETPDELVPVAVDARRPQSARVQALMAANLDRKQALYSQMSGLIPPSTSTWGCRLSVTSVPLAFSTIISALALVMG